MEKEQIIKLLTVNEDTIYRLIGHFDSKNKIGLSDQDVETLIESGKKWEEEKREGIRDKICNNPQITNALKSSGGLNDKVTLVLLISDILSSITLGVPAIYVSALIVKIGLKRYCKQ